MGKPQGEEIYTTSGLTSIHFPLTSMKRTQKGSDLEVTSLSRRFWPQTDNSTLQTQYWEPTGPAGVGVTVYAMDSSGRSSRQSVGHENEEKPQCKQKGRKRCQHQWVGHRQRGCIQNLML